MSSYLSISKPQSRKLGLAILFIIKFEFYAAVNLPYQKDSKCVSICDSNQCLSDYKCPLNSLCTDKCDGYDCHCQRGFQMVENVCKPVRQNVFAETAKPERHRKPKKNSNSHKWVSEIQIYIKKLKKSTGKIYEHIYKLLLFGKNMGEEQKMSSEIFIKI